jgi:predicted outer membrane protein
MINKFIAMTAVATALATPAFAQDMGDFRLAAMQSNAFEVQSSQIALQKSRNPQVVRYAKEALRDHRAANVALAGGERNVMARNDGLGGLVTAPLAIAGGAVGAATGAATGVVGGTLSGGPVGGLEGLGAGARRGAATGAMIGDVDTTAGTTLVQPSPQQQAMLAELSQTPAGPRFDRLYGSMQVQAHQMALPMYQSYAANGPNPALRAHAQQALPVLEHHYQMAQRLPGAR